MDIQALVPQRSVEGRDEAVIRRFARSTEVQPNFMVIGPHVYGPPTELAPVIDEYAFGRAPLLHQAVDYGNHILGGPNPVSWRHS
jgi:hypothetical protein